MDYSNWNYSVSCCKEAIIGMRIAEVFFMVIGTMITIIFILTIIKTKVLHANLRALFLATSLTNLFLMYIRIDDLLNTTGVFIDGVVVHVAKYIGWMFDCLLLLLILMERYYAIRHNDTYDETSMNWPYRIVAVIATCFVTICVLAVLSAAGLIPRALSILSLLVIVILALLLYIISLPITYTFSKRLEKNRFLLNVHYVNGRFQTYESIRSHRMLRYYIPFQVGTLLTILAAGISFKFLIVPTHPTYFTLMQQSAYFLFAPRAIAGMLIVLCLHPSLKKTALELIPSRSRARVDSYSPTTVAPYVPIKSLCGKDLNFDTDHQRDIYFEGYADLWRI